MGVREQLWGCPGYCSYLRIGVCDRQIGKAAQYNGEAKICRYGPFVIVDPGLGGIWD